MRLGGPQGRIRPELYVLPHPNDFDPRSLRLAMVMRLKDGASLPIERLKQTAEAIGPRVLVGRARPAAAVISRAGDDAQASDAAAHDARRLRTAAHARGHLQHDGVCGRAADARDRRARRVRRTPGAGGGGDDPRRAVAGGVRPRRGTGRCVLRGACHHDASCSRPPRTIRSRSSPSSRCSPPRRRWRRGCRRDGRRRSIRWRRCARTDGER